VKGPQFKQVGEFLLEELQGNSKASFEIHDVEILYNKHLQEFINSYDRVK